MNSKVALLSILGTTAIITKLTAVSSMSFFYRMFMFMFMIIIVIIIYLPYFTHSPWSLRSQLIPESHEYLPEVGR